MTKLDDPRVVRIAWIRKEDYLAHTFFHKDGQLSEESWERWEKRAKKLEAGLKARGFIVERMFIDSKTFVEWRRQRQARSGREDLLH